jgi:hypothetical protein
MSLIYSQVDSEKKHFGVQKACYHITDQRKTFKGKEVKRSISVFPRTIPKTSTYFLEKMPAVSQLA